MLFPAGYTFDTPPPEVTPDGIKPFPSTGARKLNLRTLFFYGYTGITPAMCMRLTNLGSQYLVAFKDVENNYFDGAKSYRMTLPPDMPQARFWSLTLYDNQTRSMLQTPQLFPRAGSQNYPSPAKRRSSWGWSSAGRSLRGVPGSDAEQTPAPVRAEAARGPREVPCVTHAPVGTRPGNQSAYGLSA
jgi:hypothetical protein